MKKIAFNTLAAVALCAALSSCDQKNEPIDNLTYINDAVGDPTTEVVMGDNDGDVSTMTININTSQVAAVDTKVTLALDQATLDDYNRRNQTEYAVIPAEYIDFPSEVIIPAGASSTPVIVNATSFKGEAGVEYAAPIKITSSEASAISAGAGALVVTFGKTLVQAAPGFISANAMSVPWAEQVDFENGLTLEWWSRVTNTAGTGGFSINNQALFSFEANAEIYIRFGDITYGNKYNFLQIKTMGIDANYDSGNPAEKPLKWGEWIHFAHVYDPVTGECILYQNGTEVCRVQGPVGNIFNVTGLTMCGAGSYHRDVLEMCQVRMWKTVRTATQIQKNYKKEVKYTDPNLVFYFPMNEGSGSTLADVTGNGHDITIGNKGGNANPRSWNTYRFE